MLYYVPWYPLKIATIRLPFQPFQNKYLNIQLYDASFGAFTFDNINIYLDYRSDLSFPFSFELHFQSQDILQIRDKYVGVSIVSTQVFSIFFSWQFTREGWCWPPNVDTIGCIAFTLHRDPITMHPSTTSGPGHADRITFQSEVHLHFPFQCVCGQRPDPGRMLKPSVNAALNVETMVPNAHILMEKARNWPKLKIHTERVKENSPQCVVVWHPKSGPLHLKPSCLRMVRSSFQAWCQSWSGQMCQSHLGVDK